jgi:hypothetical protein
MGAEDLLHLDRYPVRRCQTVSLLAFFTLAFKALSAALDFLREKRAFEGAEAEIMAAHAKGALDDIRDAQKTKAEVDARTSGPDASAKLRDDAANLYRD